MAESGSCQRSHHTGHTATLWLSSRSTERREGWRRVQPRREIANVGFHRGMPEAIEAKEIHLLHGLFRGPLFNGHTIGRGENTGPIVAEAAVHENFLRRLA